jgi:hypothetical protein
LLLLLDDVPSPPEGTRYEFWAREAADGEYRFLGPLTTAANLLTQQIPVEYSGRFDQFVISIGPANNASPNQPGEILFSGEVAGEVNRLVNSFLAGEGEKGTLFSAAEQANLALEHATYLQESLAAGDMPGARLHAEHVVNLLDGADGRSFGDLTGDGQAENPGDGVGVRGYLGQAAELAQSATLTTGNQQFHAAQIIAFGEGSLAQVEASINEAKRVAATDSAAEAQPIADTLVVILQQLLNGDDADGNGVVDPLRGEGSIAQAAAAAEALYEINISRNGETTAEE